VSVPRGAALSCSGCSLEIHLFSLTLGKDVEDHIQDTIPEFQNLSRDKLAPSRIRTWGIDGLMVAPCQTGLMPRWHDQLDAEVARLSNGWAACVCRHTREPRCSVTASPLERDKRLIFRVPEHLLKFHQNRRLGQHFVWEQVNSHLV